MKSLSTGKGISDSSRSGVVSECAGRMKKETRSTFGFSFRCWRRKRSSQLGRPATCSTRILSRMTAGRRNARCCWSQLRRRPAAPRRSRRTRRSGRAWLLKRHLGRCVAIEQRLERRHHLTVAEQGQRQGQRAKARGPRITSTSKVLCTKANSSAVDVGDGEVA